MYDENSDSEMIVAETLQKRFEGWKHRDLQNI